MTSSQDNNVFFVKGNSMLPLLHTGDEVKLRPIERRDIQLGDILVFVSPQGSKIIHRVIALDPLLTRGDNNGKDDLPVPLESPLYKAISYKKKDVFIPLTCGECGTREFKNHQRRRRLRQLFQTITSPLAGLNPLNSF